MTETKRWWHRFVDLAAIIWIGLFVVDLASGQRVLLLSPRVESTVEVALLVLLLVFIFELVLLYRWSEQKPRAFVRSNWILIVAVIPWFRPLRLLRVGRSVRALRVLTRSRRVGALLNKVRRTGARLWQRLRE